MLIFFLLFTHFSYTNEDKISYSNKSLMMERTNIRKKILSLKLQLVKRKANKIPILLYHHILKQEEIDKYGWNKNDCVISLESFKKQMDYLKDNDYKTITLNQLELFIDGKLDLPKKTVVITFDDGYLSSATYAYPVMKEYGFKGAVFIIGKMALRGEDTFKPEDLQYLSIADIYKYQDVFEFGCHTFNLHHKDKETGLSLLQILPEEKIIEDLTHNLQLLNTKYMAYPFGEYNSQTIKYLKKLGYVLGFTAINGYVSKNDNKYELRRIMIGPDTKISKFRALINP